MHKTKQPSSSGIFSSDIKISSSLKIEDAWLTTKEAAEYLRVPVTTLWNLSSNGIVPYYKLGRSNRYLEADLRSLLLSKRKGGFHGNKV